MTKDWGYSSAPSLVGWIRLIFIWLIPDILIVPATFGLVWLARKIGKFRPRSSY